MLFFFFTIVKVSLPLVSEMPANFSISLIKNKTNEIYCGMKLKQLQFLTKQYYYFPIKIF